MPDKCLHPQMNSSTSHETSIQSLASKTGTSLEETRVLFNKEFARLARHARVRTYLHVLATANVRSILRRGSRGAKVHNGSERPGRYA
jgi:hypothetical protein